jgi:hypothetical protein
MWWDTLGTQALIDSRSETGGTCTITQFGLPPPTTRILTSSGQATRSDVTAPYQNVGTWRCSGASFVARFDRDFRDAGTVADYVVVDPYP